LSSTYSTSFHTLTLYRPYINCNLWALQNNSTVHTKFTCEFHATIFPEWSVLECAIRKVQENQESKELGKTHQLLVSADSVILLGSRKNKYHGKKSHELHWMVVWSLVWKHFL
jgi:hypothetical protein